LGQSEKTVVQGVPRFLELLNSTRTPKMVNCKIFFPKGNSSIQELRETVGHNLVCLTMKDLADDIEICLDKEYEPWYEPFKVLYNNKFEEHDHCLSIKLNQKILFKYRIQISDIANRIESEYDDLCCVFSPQQTAKLDIFIDMSRIKFTDKQLLFVNDDNMNEIYIEEVVLPILEKMVVFGIPGIQSIYYTKDKDDTWFIETDGSNFKMLLGHSIIDYPRLQSNNVWDIYENLGIEAAREFLILEFEILMEGINMSHVKLLVEKMTYSGTITSITRYTNRKGGSVLSRASFEELTIVLVILKILLV
jgi:DNA-directed RNA polymerase beta' subunit